MRYTLGVTHRDSASSKEPLCRHSEGACGSARITKDAKERAGATGLRKTWTITISSCVSLCGSVF